MDRYEAALKSLNREQREAVEIIDGPVMVIAGPGTGKTQLIGTRVGYILQNTDTPADAVLLLTFTEAGVQAMRERLNRLIGKAAYDVQLSTYHAFGGEIFRRYPEYFEGAELTLIEDLGSDSLLREIIAKLPYSNPLKFADSYIGDIKSFISESKRALLSPEDIDDIADSNIKFINAVNKACKPLLGRLSAVSKKSVPVFEEMLTFLSSSGNGNLPHNVTSLGRYAQGELEVAIEHFNQTGKTSQLTEWKRRWMAKDSEGNSIIDGERLNRRLKAGAAIYRQYQKSLKERRQYDYDDMILRAIGLLEANPDLRFSLAERYSYIMLDEFQDTNPAQFRLVELLTDHPVHEGRPNVLAVGDDDQAIYAFQGADHANMATFIRHYRDVKVISLKDNYRSHQELIDTGRNIAEQIQSRLHRQLPVIEKRLVAAGKEFPEKPLIAMRQFKSDAAQYEWVAQEIRNLIKQGAEPNGIAVLAPKHRYLEPLLPYLASRKIPVSYERRENILDEPLVHQLEQMSRLVLALAESREPLANSLWLEILSYDFWNIPTEKIWSIGWQSRQTGEPWTSIILNDETLGGIGEFFLRLARLLPTTSLEQQLDALIGLPDAAGLNLAITSPMYGHYFSKEEAGADPISFSRLISELNILRSRLAGWRAGQDGPQGLRAFVEFIEGHRAAGINILNTSPYFAAADSVSLLTAYGAKGREFQTVFIVAALDEAWGSASRNQGYRLSLPANLEYIRYQGASEDERLRLLYVAATRARTRLYITAYRQDLAGRSLTNLKYLEIEEDEQGKLFARVLPPRFSRVALDESDAISHRAAADYWSRRHLPPLKAPLKDVLAPRLQNYRLSATDLNNFIDIVHHGPEDFFMRCLMRFPKAPSVGEAFGTSLHNTLRFAGRDFVSNGRLPDEKQLLETFDAQLSRIDLPDEETENLRRRGHDSLRAWLLQRGVDLKAGDRFEYSFQNEHPTIEGVRLNGIIDRLSVDEKRRTLYITDYKTGRAYHRWQSGVIKLHLFQQQLIIYKLLVENSERFKNCRV
ncbi:MAG TPA: ATP-dependent DNA helicase, partial [Candidatus Saccharimonadales bacterium]|nr:ATP-dependent DNA helicase [Candidatus Saccharimonadales bacterium]